MKNFFVVIFLILAFAACSPNNVTTDHSLEKFFAAQNVKGTFGLYDNGKNEFTIYNLSRYRDSAYLPSSTFDIVNSLVGLETGKIVDKKTPLTWDEVSAASSKKDAAANKNLTMEEAFKTSSLGYFQQAAQKVGKDTMQYWIDTLGYGSKYQKAKIDKIDSFWLDNSIKITADEQLGLVKKLYFDQLPFQKRTMRLVKDVMLTEKNSNYTLAYKTGTGFKENGDALAWITGWVIENQHVYFFVINFDGASNLNAAPLSMNILKQILLQLGFLKGRM